MHQYMIGVFHTMNLRTDMRLCIMSPHAYTCDIHVFRYTYPSKDRQSFLKTLLVIIQNGIYEKLRMRPMYI